MEGIIAKFDHKQKEKITWTEFLMFLQNEGLKRQQVNDAQLYGLGVKRLVEKDKFKLVRGNEQNLKATEYYIDQLVYMKFEKVQLVLAVFENNQVLVYDSRDFKLVQDIQFPFRMTTAKPKIKVRPQTTLRPKNQHETLDKELLQN